MFFQQFYNQGLGHASYLVGSEQTGEAFVFDRRRDVGGYFDAARVQGLRICHALDSHGHNDYLSGLAEIAARADVELWGARREPISATATGLCATANNWSWERSASRCCTPRATRPSTFPADLRPRATNPATERRVAADPPGCELGGLSSSPVSPSAGGRRSAREMVAT